MATETQIEAEIQAKGLNAPRLSPDMIDAQIVSEHCGRASEIFPMNQETAPLATTTVAMSCLTVCVLVLKNGFTVVGKSACASPENFDAELGRKIAREDARRQIWALEGYNLRTKLMA
jgi:hypothetical protein